MHFTFCIKRGRHVHCWWVSLRRGSVRGRRRSTISGQVLLRRLPQDERRGTCRDDGFQDGATSFKDEAREFCSKADSGNGVIRAFCPTCGSGLYARNGGMPDMIFVRASALDDPNLFSPQMGVRAARAPAWDAVAGGLPAFATAPQRD